jgi:hypothetical protein
MADRVYASPPQSQTGHWYSGMGGNGHGPMRRSSWGAILAGVALALVVSLLLNTLGLAVGLAVLDPHEGEQARGLAIGALVWWIIVSIISVFVGGWVGGRLAGVPRRVDGAVHGAVVWAVTILATVFLVTSAVGAIVGGTFRVLAETAGIAGEVAGPAVAERDLPRPADANWEEVSREVRQAVGAPDAPLIERQAIEERAAQLVDRARRRGEEPPQDPRQAYEEMMALLLRASRTQQEAPEERRIAVNMLVQAQMQRQQAEQRVDQWVRSLRGPLADVPARAEDLARRAEEVAEDVVDVSTAAAFAAFIMLLLTGAAGVIGGLLGAPMHLVLEERREAERDEIRKEHREEREDRERRDRELRDRELRDRERREREDRERGV